MSTVVKILHLEDNPVDADLIQSILTSANIDCEIKIVQGSTEFKHAIEKNNFNLILADYRLPMYDGISALKYAAIKCPEIPFIFVSGTLGEDAAIEALTHGAIDYVPKQKLSRLVPAILRALDEDKNKKERILAEEALRLSEERFRRLTENARDVIYRMSLPDGKYEYVSPASKEMLGYAPEEFYADPDLFKKSIHPDWLDYFRQQWVKLNKGEMPSTYEYQVIHKSGNVRWLNQRNILLKDANNLPIAIEAIVTDITERKLTEEILIENERRLKDAQRIAHIGNWELDLVNNILTWSDEIFRIFEIDPEKFGASYEAFLDAIHPDDREGVNFAYTNSLKTKSPYTIDHRLLFSDGRIKYVHEQCETLFNDTGTPIRSLGTVQDITQRRLAEIQLVKLNRIYAVLSNINQTIVRTHDINQLFALACRIAIDDGKFRMVWIGLVNHNTNKVEVVASSGVTEDYLNTINIDLDDKLRSSGPIGTALHTGKHSIFNDIENDKRMIPWHNNARKKGFKSCAAFPLLVFEKIVGVFTFYSEEKDFFHEDELKLLDEMAMDISFAMEFLETEKKRKEAEVERKKNEALNASRLHLLQVAATHSLDELLEETLNEAEKISDSCIGFYHFVEDDQVNLTLQNWSKRTKAEFCKAEGKGLHYPISDAGVWVDCVKERKTIIHNDYSSLPHKKGMPQGHAEVIRELIVPVILGDKVKAILGVGNKKSDYDEKDAETISLLANLAWEIAERKIAEESLHESELRYRLVFENSPISIWEEDFSQVKILFDDLRNEGITDIDLYFSQNPEVLQKCAELAKITNVNQAALYLHGAESKEELFAGLVNTFTPESFDTFKQELICLWNGCNEMASEAIVKTLQGEIRNVTIHFSLCPGYEQTFSKVLVSLVDITERKLAQEMLQKERNLLRIVIDNLPDGIWTKDLNFRKTLANRANVSMQGLHSIDEIIGKDDYELFPKELADGFMKDDQSVIATGKPVINREEYVCDEKDQKHFLLTTKLPFLNEKGEMIGLIGISRDITERKIAEEALRNSEERFRRLAENAVDIIYRMSIPEDKYEYISPAITSILGYSPQDFYGNPDLFYKIIHPDYQNYIEEQWEDLKKGKLPKVLEYKVLDINGNVKWVNERIIIVNDEDGNPVAMEGIVTDITDRKKSEEALKAKSDELDLYFTSSLDLLCIADTDGYFRRLNPEWETTLGFSIEELLSRRFIDFVHPDDLQSTLDAILNLENQKEVLRFTNRYLCKDGSYRWIEWNSFPAGKLIYAVARDITERKIAEQQRITNLKHFEGLDKINRAIQLANNNQQMLNDVLNVVLNCFNCDRAFLLYPCDPNAKNWRVPIEVTKPEYPGALNRDMEIPMDNQVAEVFRSLLRSDNPIKFGGETENPLPTNAAEEFGYKSLMSMAIHPKIGSPWQFGMHQCSYARIWTEDEERLFKEIGRRLSDAMTTFLIYQNLLESELRLNEAQRIAHIGYWDRDLEKNTIKLSFEAYRIFGLPEDMHFNDLTSWNKAWEKLLHPDDKGKTVTAYQNALEGIKYDVEYRIIRPNGDVRIIHSTAEITTNQSGKPIQVMGIMHDITERKQAEQALQEAHKNYVSLVNSIDGIVWEADSITFKFSFVSLQAERLLGYTIQAWLDSPTFWIDHLHPEDREWASTFCAGQVRQCLSHDFEYRMIAADGRVVWLRDIVSVSTNDDQSIRLSGIMIDITARKTVEEALRESEGKYRLLHENAGVGIGYYKTDGTVISYNTLAANHMGGKPEDFTGKSIYDIFSREEADFYMRRVKHAEKSESNTTYEDYLKMPSGDKWFLSVFSKVCDSQNKVVGIQIISQDITNQKIAEQELKEQIDEINRFNRLMIGREERMVELKEEVNMLLEKEGKPKKYNTI